MQRVAHLQAVAVNGDRSALDRLQEEVSDPALIFIAKLARTVDAAHAHHGRTQPEHARVVAHVLVGCAFRASIGTMEVERRFLADPGMRDLVRRLATRVAAAHFGAIEKAAVHLVGGRKQNRRIYWRLPHGLEHVQRSASVDGEIFEWLLQTGRYGDLRREVDDSARPTDRRVYGLTIPNVADLDFDAAAVTALEPVCILTCARPGEAIEDQYAVAARRQCRGDVAADKPCATGNQD